LNCGRQHSPIFPRVRSPADASRTGQSTSRSCARHAHNTSQQSASGSGQSEQEGKHRAGQGGAPHLGGRHELEVLVGEAVGPVVDLDAGDNGVVGLLDVNALLDEVLKVLSNGLVKRMMLRGCISQSGAEGQEESCWQEPCRGPRAAGANRASWASRLTAVKQAGWKTRHSVGKKAPSSHVGDDALGDGGHVGEVHQDGLHALVPENEVLVWKSGLRQLELCWIRSGQV
jgi:hypothetical protein